MKLVDRGPYYDKRRSNFIEDNFNWYVDIHQWTKLASDGSATVAHGGDASPPYVLLTTAATDNNECHLKSTNESFIFASDRPIFGETKILLSEAATDDANLFSGFVNAAGADLMVDDGAGMKTSASGFGIFKVDGGTVWKCWSSLSTTQTITTSTKTAGGSTAQVLAYEAQPINSTDIDVYFWVDGVQLQDTNGNKIKHTIVFSGATEMNYCPVYVKAGSTNSEIPRLYQAFASQLR
jgi:hypothetical protein